MCPMCYTSFDTPEILQEHFELSHGDNDTNNASNNSQSSNSANASINSVNNASDAQVKIKTRAITLYLIYNT